MPPLLAVKFAFVPPLASGNCPVTPVDNGRPVQLVRVPLDGVPKAGVTKVAEVVKTRSPLPFTLLPKAVATPVPRPEMPVLTGRPVQLVKVPLAGVPRTGATKVIPDGSVLLILGTPPELVINTPLLAVAIADTASPVLA